MSFFSFFSILELGKWVWVLLFHIFIYLLFLKGKRGHEFIIIIIFLICKGEGGVGLFIYYLFIFVNFLFFIFFCHIFYLLKEEGWHGFYFSPFLLFFVLCVKLLLLCFILARGRGCEFIFHF